jgi:Xaa-Pro dipeptidase
LLLQKSDVRGERRWIRPGGYFVEQRIKNIFTNCQKPVDSILLKNSSTPFIDDNFFYVSRLEQGIFEGCCAVLHQDGGLDLLVSELEAESARRANAPLHVYKTKEEYQTTLKQLINSNKTIGLNAAGLSFYDFFKLTELFPGVEFIDVSEGFSKTRLIKDDREIEYIKKACAIAEETLEEIPDPIYEGMTESELAAEINYSLERLGAEKPAFDTISSFGKNTAEPHYSHGNETLKQGDFILCDYGACYKKYNSDITRMFLFGEATDKQKEMYDVVLHAQQIAFDLIRPGITASEVHESVSAYIDSTKFKGRFIHSTGHCLGLAVHDGSGFASGNPMIIQENMVLTVEPGVYLPGFGGVRIEDDIRVTKNGMELLTKSSRELIELE